MQKGSKMAVKILRYPVDYGWDGDGQILQIPKGGIILSARILNRTLYIFAQVDTDKPIICKTVYIANTGDPLPVDIEQFQYITTIPFRARYLDGATIKHVYVEI
jgi:hypothetical protein